MNYSYVALYLLVSSTTGSALLHADQQDAQKARFTGVMHSTYCQYMDGKIPAIVLEGTRELLEKLLKQNQSPHPDRVITLHDLAASEAAGKIDPTKVASFLQRCFNLLIKTIARDSAQFQAIKPILDALVEEWAVQLKAHDTLFYRFNKAWKQQGSELEILSGMIHSLQEYEAFLLQQIAFLESLKLSLPKSYAFLERSKH